MSSDPRGQDTSKRPGRRRLNWNGGPDPEIRLRTSVMRTRRAGHGRERMRWVYVAGNRRGLRALQYAIGKVLASRSLEIVEGPGYTVIYDRHSS